MTTDATDREALLRRLLAQRGLARADSPIPRRDPDRPVPLSPLQEGLWFLDRLLPGSSAYVLPWAARLRGAVDPDALQGALDTVVARHEALRTALVPAADGGAVQAVLGVGDPRTRVPLRRAELPAGDPAALDRAMRTEVETAFDLTAPPLLRALLIRLADDEHVLVVCIHHVVADDRSLAVVVGELLAAYAALGAGRRPELGEPGCQYPDYAVWLRERLGGDGLARQRAYWAERLAGAPAGLDLPTDRPHPATPSGRGATRGYPLPAALRAGVDAAARRHGATRFMVLLAGVQLLLARLAGTDDVCVGSPVTTRRRPELADAVGMFVTSVPIRTRLDGDPTLAEALDRVRASCVGAIDHADLPFDRIVEAARAPRAPGRNPLFQVMFVLNPPRGIGTAAGGTTVEPIGLGRDTTRMDLTVFVDDTDDGLGVLIDYDTDLYDAATVDRLVERLDTVLTALVERPGTRLSALDVRGPGERAAQAARRGTDREYPAATSVADLVAAVAAARPDAPAVVAGDEVLRYGELLARADRLARRLRAAGAGPEVPVGLALPASPAAIVALLGILRAGAGYLPLDPGHPPARLAALLAHAGAPLLVAPAGLVPGYPGVVVEPDGPQPADAPPPAPAHPDQLAYVVYTSGSTGTPKGVQVAHRSLLNLVRGFVDGHGFGPADRLLMLPPLTFDASVGDVFPALVSGAALVLHERPAELTGPALFALCDRLGVTVVDAAAPLWRRWVADLATAAASPPGSLRMVMVGGEPVPVAAVRRWAALTAGRVPVVNHYGPTEGTVCATTYRSVDAAELGGGHLPIGVPLPNVRTYVLDAALREAPIGVTGELYLGGAAPARGYLAAPLATADRFLPDPFADRPGARMYRTGDLVRQRGDGSLEFLGRADRQVKIRGHRVELGEVETAVAALPGVRQVAVVARAEAAASALVAYVVAAADPAPVADWRRTLRERLPEYLVPAAFVTVAALPLNRHGKLDEAALPPPGPTPAADHEPPGTPTERSLARIWAELLGAATVGRRDRFFDVGGNSLLAGALVARVATELGVALPVRVVFEATELAALAERVDAHRRGGAAAAATEASALERTLRADAVLPDDIGADRPAGSPPVVAGTALVTGATGFLGAYLLRDLLDAGTARVYCLVRAAGGDAALARVRDNLTRYGLWRETDTDRLVGIPGDLASPGLGLAPGVADRLADTVDAVYHNGGAVNFLQPYAQLRPANVVGTVEVLRLAGRGRPCAVHLVSTLGVYLTPARVGATVRESDPPDDCAGLGDGYNASKWVADALARAARDRGLPVSVYRPARVTGDAVTGAGNADDWFSRFLVTCVQLGGVPDLGAPADLAPVDHVAAAIGRLSRGGAVADWHFFGRTVDHVELADALTGYGYPVAPVSYRHWTAALSARPDAALAAFAPQFPPPVGDNPPPAGQPVFDCAATEAAAGAACPPVDAALLHRYLDHLVRAGSLDRPSTGSRRA